MVFFCLLAAVQYYCIGLSIGPFNSPQASMFLQLKNVSAQPIFERMDWVINPDFSLSSTFNQNTSVGLISDNDLLIRAGTVRILRFLQLNTTFGFDQWSTLQESSTLRRCVTAMKCNRGPGGFCDTNSDDPIEQVGDISLGSYLKLNPCRLSDQGTPVMSQSFRQVNHNCSMEKLQDCTKEEEYDMCDFPVFIRQKNCSSPGDNSTLPPSPTPSLRPSPEPTMTPLELTEMTPEPSFSNQPSLQPSSSPSSSPSKEPSPPPPPNNGDNGLQVLSVLVMAVPIGLLVLYVKGLWPF